MRIGNNHGSRRLQRPRLPPSLPSWAPDAPESRTSRRTGRSCEASDRRDVPLKAEALEQHLLHHPPFAHHRPNLPHPTEQNQPTAPQSSGVFQRNSQIAAIPPRGGKWSTLSGVFVHFCGLQSSHRTRSSAACRRPSVFSSGAPSEAHRSRWSQRSKMCLTPRRAR